MENRYCIVTGANAGIGLETTAGLVSQGAHVVMACRNAERCAAARQVIEARGGTGSCECEQLDLADYESVRGFASRVAAKLSAQRHPLDALVNNAGVMGVPPKDGIDGHLAPNHFGPFLLTNLMLPSMGPGGRIVNLASRAHNQGSLRVEGNKISGTSWHWYFQYCRSKLCNVVFTAELQRQLEACNSRITTYSVSPGVVNTQIFHDLPGPIKWLVRPAAGLFQTPAQGASTVLWAATSPELEGRSHVYMHAMKPKAPSSAALDPQLGRDLWAASEKEVGLTAEEQPFLPSGKRRLAPFLSAQGLRMEQPHVDADA